MKKSVRQGMRSFFSEQRTGYLFILPAVVIICIIAIWPVVRSFWISMYDLQLNNPAKSEIHTKYAIDMERYVSTSPILLRTLKREMDVEGGAPKQTLEKLYTQVEELDVILNREELVRTRYDEVEKLLYDFKPVPAQLKYAEVDNEIALEVVRSLEAMELQLQQMKKEKILSHPDDMIGLVRAWRISFVEPNFIGLDHYKTFIMDKRMWLALWNTSVFTIFSVSIELIFGLAVALLINKQFRGRGLIRAAILIPWATPTAISALMWQFLYDGQNGIIAKLFSDFNLISNTGVLLSTKSGAMFSIIFADVWKTTPFIALLLLAGLQTIPNTMYEAAKVDGAGKAQQLWLITLPLLKPAILVALLFRTLDAFRVFDLIYVLTGGGPANSTESISIYAYKMMFAQLDFGAGSALSVIVFICIALICMIYVKLLGSDALTRRMH